ncbi:hypothetical protein BSN85_26055 [Bradyrhizobium brasilense]|nr:hypothetical protein BSN85_26055 [Bradyrhizobium brasilense]
MQSAGSTYRAITEARFAEKLIPDRAWKTHDLRSRTVRLTQRQRLGRSRPLLKWDGCRVVGERELSLINWQSDDALDGREIAGPFLPPDQYLRGRRAR